MTGRRAVLAGAAALALAGPAAAADRMVPAKKLFPYLDAYLRLPAAKRSRFTLTYVLVKDRPTGLWIVDGAQKIAIPIGPDGRLLRTPTAAQWDTAQVQVSGPDGAKYGITMKLMALATPATEMDAAGLAAAVTQANDGVRSAMGVAGLMAPKIERIAFEGVAAGEVIYADGRRAALPLVKGAPSFEPGKHAGARTLRFAKAPGALLLD
jgi:hypothetical protein